jgi:Domain of unknown function (DUF5664)
MSGTKHDGEKPILALIDSDFIDELGAVLTFGQRKYAAQNWRGGISTTRLLSAVLRHLFAYLRGEDKDPESGYSHLAHAACGLMFCFWTVKYKPEHDDRFKYEKQ